MRHFVHDCIFLLMFIAVVGCDSSAPTHTVVFDPGDFDMNIDRTLNVEDGETIDLPRIEEDGFIYAGWRGEDEVHSGRLMIERDMELTLIMEDIHDVFETIEFDRDSGTVTVSDYTGLAKRLVLPHTIDGYVMASIPSNAFEDTRIESVEIPNSVTEISPRAFKNANALREVSFYGEFMGETRDIISNDRYEDILQNNSDVCTPPDTVIPPSEEQPWEMGEGCPILRVTETIGLPGEDAYQAYAVVFDANLYPDAVDQKIRLEAFIGAAELKTFHFPKRLSRLGPDIFEGTALRDISIEANDTFYVEDNVLYMNDSSDDDPTVALYPPARPDETYVVPEDVTTLTYPAFSGNRFMNTIVLHEDIVDVSGQVLSDLAELTAVEVDENNMRYTDMDGVLFSRNGKILVAYPLNRDDPVYDVPAEVEIILEYAFAFNRHLTEIALPNGSLAYIDAFAFYCVESLNRIDLPASVFFIGDNAFYDPVDPAIKTVIIRPKEDPDLMLNAGVNPIAKSEGLVIYVPDESFERYADDHAVFASFSDYLAPFSSYEGTDDNGG